MVSHNALSVSAIQMLQRKLQIISLMEVQFVTVAKNIQIYVLEKTK